MGKDEKTVLWQLVFKGGKLDGQIILQPFAFDEPAPEFHKNEVTNPEPGSKPQVKVEIYRLEGQDKFTEPPQRFYCFKQTLSEEECQAQRASSNPEDPP